MTLTERDAKRNQTTHTDASAATKQTILSITNRKGFTTYEKWAAAQPTIERLLQKIQEIAKNHSESSEALDVLREIQNWVIEESAPPVVEDEKADEVFCRLGFNERTLDAPKTRQAISVWLDLGFDFSAIEMAVAITKEKTDRWSLKYAEHILAYWHKKGWHTAQEILSVTSYPQNLGSY